jgi:hypothetical protein
VVTVDDTNDRVDFDTADVTWSALGGTQTIAKFFAGYDDDTTSGTNANVVPLSFHSFDVVTDGSDITATISNLFRAS